MPLVGPVSEALDVTIDKLKSTMMNTGASDLAQFRERAVLTLVSEQSIVEGGTSNVFKFLEKSGSRRGRLGQLKPISVILRRRVTKQDACYEKVVSQVNWIGNGGFLTAAMAAQLKTLLSSASKKQAAFVFKAKPVPGKRWPKLQAAAHKIRKRSTTVVPRVTRWESRARQLG